jgi:hypothetical protein
MAGPLGARPTGPVASTTGVESDRVSITPRVQTVIGSYKVKHGKQ